MYQKFNDSIPQKIDKDFKKLSFVHKHYTRHTINKFHLPRETLATVKKCCHLLELSFGPN